MAALLALIARPESAEHGSANAPIELIFVSLLLLVFWGAFRVTRRRS
jgi:hypothetical protein